MSGGSDGQPGPERPLQYEWTLQRARRNGDTKYLSKWWAVGLLLSIALAIAAWRVQTTA